MSPLPRKPALAIAAFVALGAVTEAVPLLHNYRFLNWDALGDVFAFHSRGGPSLLEEEQLRVRPALALERQPILSLTGPGMDRFYAALLSAERGERTVSIAHYGDSPTTADMITSDVRRSLQEEFGDAGEGFFLLAKPWAWYEHKGIRLRSGGWTGAPATSTPNADGLFGFGGVSFIGGPGAYSDIEFDDSPRQTLEVAGLRHPDGGRVRVRSATATLAEFDTSGSAVASLFERVTLPPGATRVRIEAISGRPRLFGVQMRESSSGVVYHSLGLNGAYTSVLSRMFNRDHWMAQLRHYRPDLVIINYGTNESVYPDYVNGAYEAELRTAISRIREALPNTSILIMSPMDRGHRDRSGAIVSVPGLSRLIARQQRVAASTGCAFFNTYQAMGGFGTMARWYAAEPRLVSADFIHPTPPGARAVASLLFRSLMQGYRDFKKSSGPAPRAGTAQSRTGAAARIELIE